MCESLAALPFDVWHCLWNGYEKYFMDPLIEKCLTGIPLLYDQRYKKEEKERKYLLGSLSCQNWTPETK